MPVLYYNRRVVDLAQDAPELQGKATFAPMDALLQQADMQLYQAKAQGRNRALGAH